MSTTPGFIITEMADDQKTPYATFNEAIRVIEMHGKGLVSRTTAAQPGTVTDGAAYILPASPTGALWSTFAEHDLVLGVGGTWKKYTPIEGTGAIWVNDEDVHVSFNGTAWVVTSAPLNATGAAAPTVASATTIAPTTSIAFVSGTTAIATITAPSPISLGGGSITLIPTGVFTTTTAGNIALASTAVVNRALIMTYDATTAKWYPSY